MKKRRLGGWYRVALILACSVSVLGGCQSTPESRIAKKQAVFSSWSAHTQEKIRAGQIEIGYTPQQVELAKGKPDRVGRRTTAAGDRVEWVYLWDDSNFGFGLGLGAGSGHFGGGAGVSTGGGDPGVAMRVLFSADVVSAFESFSR